MECIAREEVDSSASNLYRQAARLYRLHTRAVVNHQGTNTILHKLGARANFGAASLPGCRLHRLRQ